MRSLLLIAVLAVACAYGLPSDYGRIVGGSVVSDAKEFPYLVSISDNDEHICGGFIYNDRWVATAASCLYGKDKATLLVKVGSISLITPGPEEQLIPVMETNLHPSYNNETGLNDIALLQTARPIVFSDYAKAIRYDEVLQPLEGVESNVIAGWGATFDGGIVATKLRKATIPEVDNAQVNCQTFLGFARNYMICAGGGTSSPCDFDEGTPLVQNYTDGTKIVIGVMSRAEPNCDSATSPSVYTRLTAYYAWLLQIAGQQPANVF